MSSTTRVAIYGDANLNLIDGSTIWIHNVAKLCANIDNSIVDVFSKAVLTRPQLVQDLRARQNIGIVEPREGAANGLAEVAANVRKAHVVDPYDVVVVRGLNAAEHFAAHPELQSKLWLYLTDVPQSQSELAETHGQRLRSLAEKCRYILCQTEEIRQFFETSLRVPGRQLLLLPPLVSSEAFRQYNRDDGESRYRAVYSGKFAPLWGVNDQIDVFERLRDEGYKLRFDVIGDKFHDAPDNPVFVSDLRQRLLNTDGLQWHGGLPQDVVFDIQKQCDIGMALRDPKMNSNLELSTKLLEYGAAGMAAIVNPTVLHRQLLGDDYPMFADDKEQAYQRLKRALDQPEILQVAAERLRCLAEQHTAEHFQETWNRYVARMANPAAAQQRGRKKRVVLAGHDLKFCKELIEYFQARKDVTLRIDKWDSLREHNEPRSRALLEWADMIVCEWCAGNAVWYSNNIDPNRQSLYVRFHRFEINSEFPAKVRLDHVNRMIFVGEHILDDASSRFGWDKRRLAIVPNFVDTLVYDRPKFEGSEFNLGLIGYVPMLKRLDRTLDILEELLQHDRRYRLFVKGRHPWEYPWIWRKEEEREHYENAFSRLRDNPVLREQVVFDPFGDDIPAWLRKIGCILSVSDIESFHLAAAEGLASGANAVFVEREGVREIFPGCDVVGSTSAAAEAILASTRSTQGSGANREKVAMYSYEAVSAALDELFFE